MKKALFALLIILASCHKEAQEQPANTECMAATFYIDTYTDYTYTKKVETWVAIHFCEVCGYLLESYKRLPKDQAFCGAPVPSRERIVLGRDNCKKSAQ